MKGLTFGSILFSLIILYSGPVYGFGPPRPKPSQPVPVADPIKPSGELKIKILSYNVHGLHLPWLDTSHLRDIGKVLAERRRKGTAPQIVAIQEGFHQDVAYLINEAGYPYRKDGPGPTFGRAGSGLILLSEFPIVGTNSMVFNHDNSAGFDWDANKGIHYTQIRLPGMPKPLELLNTHMQADYNTAFDPLHVTQAARRRQIVELGDFLWRTASRDGPVVFVGDFNTNTVLGDYYDILARTFLTAASETCLIARNCVTNTDPLKEMQQSLDHHFYRRDSKIKMEPLSYEKTFREPYNGRVLSDHEGVEVTYRISW